MMSKIRRVGETVEYLFGSHFQYLWQYTKDAVKKAVEWLIVLVAGLLGLWIFVHIIQPVLIDIHPMFAEQSAGSMGRRSDSPTELALSVTIFITIALSLALKWGIQEAFDSGIREGVMEFLGLVVFLPLFPILPALITLGELAVAILPAWLLPDGYGEEESS